MPAMMILTTRIVAELFHIWSGSAQCLRYEMVLRPSVYRQTLAILFEDVHTSKISRDKAAYHAREVFTRGEKKRARIN